MDVDTTRGRIYDGVRDAFSGAPPLENQRYRPSFSDVDYADPPTYSRKDEKQALLRHGDLNRRLRGTLTLTDIMSGEDVARRTTTLMRVPHLTSRGTYIRGGNEYTLSNQLRLLSGAYARRKKSGEYEAHFNILNRAPSFRVIMDPETGVFNFQVGKAKIPAYPVFQALGVGDDEMASTWGPELLKLNREKGSRNPAQAVQKVYDRLGAVRARQASCTLRRFPNPHTAGSLWHPGRKSVSRHELSLRARLGVIPKVGAGWGRLRGFLWFPIWGERG